MSKTTSRTTSQESFLQRLIFTFFSLLRHSKNKPGGILPTIESQAIIQASDDRTFVSQGPRKEVLFFRIIEFFYLHITSISQAIFKGIAKTTKLLFSPIRIISLFLFERILDVTEWIYTIVLYPLYYRFGYLYQATLVGLKSKPVIIMILVVLSSFLVRYYMTNLPRTAFIFILLPVILVLVFFYPILGLCCYLFFGLGLLNKMIWGFPQLYTGSPMIVAIAVSYAFRIVMGREKEFCWVQHKLNLIILAIWSIVLIAAFSTWSRGYFYLNFVGWFVVYFLAILVIGSKKQRLLSFLFALVVLYGLYGYNVTRTSVSMGLNSTYSVTADGKGRLADNNELAASLNMALPLMLAFCLTSKNKFIKIGFFTIYIITCAAVISTNSRGGLVGLATITTLILFKFILPNKKLRKKGIALLLVFAITGFFLFRGRVTRRTESIAHWEQDSSAINRVVGVFTGFTAMFDRPVFGVGAGEMRRCFAKYCPHKITIQYWFGEENKMVFDKLRVHNAEVHNIYASIGGENGAFVLVLWCCMLFYAIWRHHLFRRKMPKTLENEWAHLFSHALEISLISYMVTGMFLSNYSEGLTYMIIAASVSLEYIVFRKKERIEIVSIIWLLVLFFIWAYHTYWFRFLRPPGAMGMTYIP